MALAVAQLTPAVGGRSVSPAVGGRSDSEDDSNAPWRRHRRRPPCRSDSEDGTLEDGSRAPRRRVESTPAVGDGWRQVVRRQSGSDSSRRSRSRRSRRRGIVILRSAPKRLPTPPPGPPPAPLAVGSPVVFPLVFSPAPPQRPPPPPAPETDDLPNFPRRFFVWHQLPVGHRGSTGLWPLPCCQATVAKEWRAHTSNTIIAKGFP